MCCFNYPIDHVYATRIFVGERDGTQITVYSASLHGSRIEMVLPVRTRGAAEVEWVNLESYPAFFEDCERAFYVASRSKGVAAAGMGAPGGFLRVEKVGKYRVSFAPSWRDLDRADPAVFQLSDRLKRVMTEHYPEGEFGFVIYKPDQSGEMHPLAYRHAVRTGDPLFVPTRHEHGHEGPPDWDHHIYHQGGADHIGADSRQESPTPCRQVFAAPQQAGKPVPRELDLSRPLRRLTRKQSYPNGDLELVRAAASVGPIAATAVALGGAAAARAVLGPRRRQSAPSESQFRKKAP